MSADFVPVFRPVYEFITLVGFRRHSDEGVRPVFAPADRHAGVFVVHRGVDFVGGDEIRRHDYRIRDHRDGIAVKFVQQIALTGEIVVIISVIDIVVSLQHVSVVRRSDQSDRFAGQIMGGRVGCIGREPFGEQAYRSVLHVRQHQGIPLRKSHFERHIAIREERIDLIFAQKTAFLVVPSEEQDRAVFCKSAQNEQTRLLIIPRDDLSVIGRRCDIERDLVGLELGERSVNLKVGAGHFEGVRLKIIVFRDAADEIQPVAGDRRDFQRNACPRQDLLLGTAVFKSDRAEAVVAEKRHFVGLRRTVDRCDPDIA